MDMGREQGFPPFLGCPVGVCRTPPGENQTGIDDAQAHHSVAQQHEQRPHPLAGPVGDVLAMSADVVLLGRTWRKGARYRQRLRWCHRVVCLVGVRELWRHAEMSKVLMRGAKVAAAGHSGEEPRLVQDPGVG